MKKKIAVIIIVCLSIVLTTALVGCGGEKVKYTYEFTFDGGQVLHKTGAVYEIRKDNKTIGYIDANGEIRDDGVYVEENADGYNVGFYILTSYDGLKAEIKCSNGSLTKVVNPNGQNEVVHYSSGTETSSPTISYFFVENYKISKKAKENIKISLSGLELFSAMSYNWELFAIEKTDELVETVVGIGSNIIIGESNFKVGEDVLINLNLNDGNKTIMQKYGEDVMTADVECVLENGIYSLSFAGQNIFATIINANYSILGGKQLLRLDIGNNMIAYLTIKK